MSDYVIVNIPNLGGACVRAGVDHFQVRFGPRYVNASDPSDVPNVVVFGKPYREEISVSVDGSDVEISRYTSFTPAAVKKVRELVALWAAGFAQTPEARAMVGKVNDQHRGYDLDRIKRDIERTTNHLRELEMLADKIRAADPGEYVPIWNTTYEIRERPNK
jgi:hypothetical protein